VLSARTTGAPFGVFADFAVFAFIQVGNTLVVFQGYDNRCRKKLFGLVNCCKRGGSDGSQRRTART